MFEIQEHANAIESLNFLKKQLVEPDSKCINFSALTYFTKGEAGHSSGSLWHDVLLEERTKAWLNEQSTFESKMSWYANYDPSLTYFDWPKHYATRLITAYGKIAENQNIFMFFPEVLGVQTGKLEDYFGFEFIDIWRFVFDEVVFPCIRVLFDDDSINFIYSKLAPRIEETSYLASVFHEIGHRVGHWKVSPNKHPAIDISKFNTDVLGELSTDVLLVNALEEFPEIGLFVFFQRLFWFGRRGFAHSPDKGNINFDNDAWIGSLLWNFSKQFHVIETLENGALKFNYNNLPLTFKALLAELDTLGELVVAKENQDTIIMTWMKKFVSYQNNEFLLPDDFAQLLNKCSKIPEKPSQKFL